LGEAKFENYQRDSKIVGGQTEKLYTPVENTRMPDSQANMPLHFNDDQHMALLEAQARKDNLQFIEELVFENGAVYKGKEISREI